VRDQVSHPHKTTGKIIVLYIFNVPYTNWNCNFLCNSLYHLMTVSSNNLLCLPHNALILQYCMASAVWVIFKQLSFNVWRHQTILDPGIVYLAYNVQSICSMLIVEFSNH
jgi:hypothetical protein